MAGPAIWSTLFASPISALASCSRASLAACLMSPIWAGRENAAAEQQDRREDLCRALDDVAAHEDRPTGDPVGEHAAEQEQDDDRDLAGEHDDAEVSGAAEPEHGERERHIGHAGAQGGDRGRRQIAGEAPLAEHFEGLGQSHPRSVCGEPGRGRSPSAWPGRISR
jgi:hypothetical protein